jgi:serine/threonine protein kinase
LKLENILFQNSDNMYNMTVVQSGKTKDIYIPNSFKIKIIDFGGATFDHEHKSTIVNTRQYRGPEVRTLLFVCHPFRYY